MPFKQKFRIVRVYDPRIKERAPYIGLQVKVQDWAEGRTLTWLHLSDVHCKAHGETAMLMQGDTLGKLIEQLPDLLGYWALEPDAVFVTGDIAFSGRPEEYREAFDFFKRFGTLSR